MSWLTEIALKKRWLTFLIVALVTLASIWAAITIKQEMIPDIELPIALATSLDQRAPQMLVVALVSPTAESA